MLVGRFGVCLGTGSDFDLFYGFGDGHFRVVPPKQDKNMGHEKVDFLVSRTHPQNYNVFFSSLYQCWLNCQKIFFVGNP